MKSLWYIGKKLIEINGCHWTFLYALYWSARFFLKIDPQGLYRSLILLEERRNLPGFNSAHTAGAIWDLLPWEKSGGEEWTVSPQWKESIVRDVLYVYIRPAAAILEIGCGAGRWTEILQPLAKKLYAVDVSGRAIELCRKRLSGACNVDYYLTSGTSLRFIPDAAIDAIWSFDVFVHINPQDTDDYLSEIRRVLVPGGTAVIHHPQSGGLKGGCRSRMTAALFAALLEKHGLTLVRQFDSWGEDGRFNLYRYGDCISVFHA